MFASLLIIFASICVKIYVYLFFYKFLNISVHKFLNISVVFSVKSRESTRQLLHRSHL